VTRRRRGFGSGSFAAVGLVFAVLMLPSGAGARAQSPVVHVLPAAASPTATVTVSGTGYPAGETIRIQLNATLLTTATANSSGDFITQVKIPASATPGHKAIHATGLSCGCTAQTPFTVIAAWMQLQNTSTHTGVQAHEPVLSTATVPGLTLKWTSPSPGCGNASPSLSVWSGMVYTAGYALDAKTGAVVWQNSARSFGNAPAVGDGEVFFGGRSGGDGTWVTAVDAVNGATRWNTKIGDHNLFSSPVAANGRVFIGADFTDDHFYALDDATGAVIWSKHVAGGFSATASVANGVVYAGFLDGKVRAFSGNTGALLWEIADSAFFASPAIVDAQVFIAGNGSNVYDFALP